MSMNHSRHHGPKKSHADGAVHVEGNRFVASDGVSIFYRTCCPRAWSACPARTVVLLHGVPLSSESLECLIEDLCKAGLRVVAPDLRGFGLSGTPPTDAGFAIERYLRDIDELLALLRLGAVTLGGHSFGGFLAQRYAALNPGRVPELVLIASSPRFLPGDDFAFPISPALLEAGGPFLAANNLPGFLGVFVPAALPETCPGVEEARRVATCIGLQSGGGSTRAITGVFGALAVPGQGDNRPLLASIRARTLIVAGSLDVVAPPGASIVLRQGIADSSLVELPNRGHFFFLTARHRLSQLVLEFLCNASRCRCDICRPHAAINGASHKRARRCDGGHRHKKH